MRTSNWSSNWVLRAQFIVLLCGSLLQCGGQGTRTVAFDLPPILDPGQGDSGPEYVESGVRFKPLFAGTVITQGVLRFRGPYAGFPDNDTMYFGGADGLTNTLVFHRADGGIFGLFSVELADYNTVFPGPGTVHFVGYRTDGAVVTTDLVLDRLVVDGRPAFQTFYFGPEFARVERVEVPSHYWWMDNLVVFIPEPSAVALFLLSASLLGWRWHRARRR